MEREHSNDDRVHRRTFLRRSVGAWAGAVGIAGAEGGFDLAGQSDDEPIPRLRAVLPRIDLLANEYLHRLLIFTEHVDGDPPPGLAGRCVAEDRPQRLDRLDAIVADWEGVRRLTPETMRESIDRIVRTHAFLPPGPEVSVGAPYIIVGGYECADGYLNVAAHKLPGAVRDGVLSSVDY